MKVFAARYERAARLVLVLFVVNIAFIAHTLLGAVVAGFFPSVAASYAIFREWVLSDDRSWTALQAWVRFHHAWRDELRAANLFGWPQLVLGLVLAWDYYVANWNDMGVGGIAASGVLLVVNVTYGIFVLLSWAVRSHFDERPWWIVRASLRMVIARPLCSLMTVGVLLITVWAWAEWPGILVCFGFIIPIYAVVLTVSVFGRLPRMDSHPRSET